MRITCDVEVVNRLLPSLNMRGKTKALRSQLSVGKKPGAAAEDPLYLMMCTKNDRNGAKYLLPGNIEQVFTKFIAEGKATIRFTNPPHDLCISKVDAVQLRGFLSVLRLGWKGGDVSKVTLASLAPASSKTVERLQTRLHITSRRTYPLTTAFPSSLEVLSVHGCNMRKMDSRMLQLRNLTSLDLSHNKLHILPENFEAIRNLSELKLADNAIGEIPHGLCTGILSRTLALLDLSENKLTKLRPYFCSLRSLVTLKLDNNELPSLPTDLGKLQSLRSLTVTQNSLRLLPASFSQLRLDNLDLSANSFLDDGPSTIRSRLEFPSLLECTAKAIRKYRVAYGAEDLPGHLVKYLESGKWCLCGNPCFDSFVHYLAQLDLHRVSANITALDTAGRTHAPAEAFLCSQRCLDNYQKNPNAMMWR